MDLVSQILNVFTVYDYLTEAIVASVCHPRYVLDAATLGAEIATVPYAALQPSAHRRGDRSLPQGLGRGVEITWHE